MNFPLNIRRSRKQTIRIEQGDKSTTRVINFGEKRVSIASQGRRMLRLVLDSIIQPKH